MLITNFKFDNKSNSSSSKARVSKYINYISTRDGVELISYKNAEGNFGDSASTVRQLDITDLNAVNNISKDNEFERNNYLEYMNARKNSHGLFSHNGVCDVELEKQKLNEAYDNDAIIWQAVFSLKREDAIKHNLNSATEWKDFLTMTMPKIAEEFNISLSQLNWHAAFHDEKHHPHVHLNFYSNLPKEIEGTHYKSNQVKQFKKVNSYLTNIIYKSEMQEIIQRKNEFKEDLKFIINNNKNLFNNNIEEIIKVAKGLPTTGQKKYGYMPKETKLKINKLFENICENSPTLNIAVEKYLMENIELSKFYNNNVDGNLEYIVQEEKNKFFNPTEKSKETMFHNMLISVLYNLKENGLINISSTNDDHNLSDKNNKQKLSKLETPQQINSNTQLNLEEKKEQFENFSVSSPQFQTIEELKQFIDTETSRYLKLPKIDNLSDSLNDFELENFFKVISTKSTLENNMLKDDLDKSVIHSASTIIKNRVNNYNLDYLSYKENLEEQHNTFSSKDKTIKEIVQENPGQEENLIILNLIKNSKNYDDINSIGYLLVSNKLNKELLKYNDTTTYKDFLNTPLKVPKAENSYTLSCITFDEKLNNRLMQTKEVITNNLMNIKNYDNSKREYNENNLNEMKNNNNIQSLQAYQGIGMNLLRLLSFVDSSNSGQEIAPKNNMKKAKQLSNTLKQNNSIDI